MTSRTGSPSETDIVTVQVFVDDEGRFGSALTVVPAAANLTDVHGLAIAAGAGTSETVLIDDARTGRLRIFVPRKKISFAGYPLIGAAWYLHRTGVQLDSLRTDGGLVQVKADDDGAGITTAPGRVARWKFQQLNRPADVESANSDGPDRRDYVWAWENEASGTIRARAFSSASGTVEDEATGGAAVDLCALLGRPLIIRQGLGSVMRVSPVEGSTEIRLEGQCRA